MQALKGGDGVWKSNILLPSSWLEPLTVPSLLMNSATKCTIFLLEQHVYFLFLKRSRSYTCAPFCISETNQSSQTAVWHCKNQVLDSSSCFEICHF